jgi:hypothetical protein
VTVLPLITIKFISCGGGEGVEKEEESNTKRRSI